MRANGYDPFSSPAGPSWLGLVLLLLEQTQVLCCSTALPVYQAQITIQAFPLLCALLACLKRRSGGLEFGVYRSGTQGIEW